MTTDKPPERTESKSKTGASWGAALLETGEDRARKLTAAVEALQQEMRQLSATIGELVLACPPTELLGFLWGQIHIKLSEATGNNGAEVSTKDILNQFQFALEYVHAVWSCYPLPELRGGLEQEKAEALLDTLGKLQAVTMNYNMASAAASESKEFGEASSDIEFHAKSCWVMLRGNRYQVLEEEFLRFALAPHDNALRAAYGVGANEIAGGIQATVDTMRRGFSDVAEVLDASHARARKMAAEQGIEIDAAIERIQEEDTDYGPKLRKAMNDLFFGGLCNVSQHARLPLPVDPRKLTAASRRGKASCPSELPCLQGLNGPCCRCSVLTQIGNRQRHLLNFASSIHSATELSTPRGRGEGGGKAGFDYC